MEMNKVCLHLANLDAFKDLKDKLKHKTLFKVPLRHLMAISSHY